VPTVAVQTTPKVRKPHIQVLADDELATLFQYIKERPLYMPVLFAASTGMRRGEILGLRWCDLDFDRSTSQIAQIVEALKKSVSIKEPKTERSRRTIVLPATIVQELKAHRKAQAEHLPQTRVQSVRAGVPDLGWETNEPASLH
jgi:integrase